MADNKSISFAALTELAHRCGLEIAGVLPLDPAAAALARRRDALALWQSEGFAGEMEYMRRDASLFVDLQHLLPSVRSVVGFVVPYGKSDPAIASVPEGYGRVARYAWGRDYHRVLKKRLKGFVAAAAKHTPGLEWRTFADAVPLLERALLSATERGFIGNNSMFIVPGMGSFTFLAEILWNVEVEALPVVAAAKGSCGTCRRCLDTCPTSAFAGPMRLDARKCISYLTIEKKTVFTPWERQALGTWIFGCDICQDVCPFNHAAGEGVAEFQAKSGTGPFLSLVSLLRIREQQEFHQRFQGTPLMRAGRASMLRNASCVVANTRFFAALPELLEAATRDSDGLVRLSCAQALHALLPDADGAARITISNLLGKPDFAGVLLTADAATG